MNNNTNYNANTDTNTDTNNNNTNNNADKQSINFNQTKPQLSTSTGNPSLHDFWHAPGKESVIDRLRSSPEMWSRYRLLEKNPKWKQWFLDFVSGGRILPILYDAFFKRLFLPDIYPDRLSSLIGSIIGKKVTVLHVLSNEDVLIEGGALIIMDIIVQLEDGSVANVEVQKIPYSFPGERMSCYSSDLVIRQYSRVKGDKGISFTYNDLKKVYTIVFFEATTMDFKADYLEGNYLHIGTTTFNTGLNINMLQEYYIIALDVFRENIYPKVRQNADYMQTAWLSLLSARTLDDAEELLKNYPFMEDILRDMAEYLRKPEEVLSMFSDALRQLDKNTELYMIEELEQKIKSEKQRADSEKNRADSAELRADSLQNENTSLQNENTSLQSENTSLQSENTSLQNENSSLQNENQSLLKEIEKLKQQLQNS